LIKTSHYCRKSYMCLFFVGQLLILSSLRCSVKSLRLFSSSLSAALRSTAPPQSSSRQRNSAPSPVKFHGQLRSASPADFDRSGSCGGRRTRRRFRVITGRVRDGTTDGRTYLSCAAAAVLGRS